MSATDHDSGAIKLAGGAYTLLFVDGGVAVIKNGKRLYFNRRPMYATVKSSSASSGFYDGAYRDIRKQGEKVLGTGVLRAPSGAAFSFTDTYEVSASGFKISRRVEVVKAADDLGFSTKISLVTAESDDPRDYHCFAPGVWYKQNEFAGESSIGKDLDCEYYWRYETCYGLPVFAMQHAGSGETAALSRWAADMTMRSLDIVPSESYTDPKCTTGSIGMSRPESRSIDYMYYGFAVRKPVPTPVDGLSLDYVYPGSEGQLPGENRFGGLDFKGKFRTLQHIYHPVRPGFVQNYSVGLDFGHYENFQQMMRSIWRTTYDRLRDRLFDVDNEAHFHHCMHLLSTFTKKYGDSFGLPFVAQLPDMDITNVSFQFGFVGQQPGIGYQLLRYGDKENRPDIYEKGVNIIDFWVRSAMTESGMPYVCYNPNMEGFEPYPHYTRMIADGIEAILDAYLYLYKQGRPCPSWLAFCRKTADWYVDAQNEDGSFFRSYNTDGSVRMDSKANTPSPIRFLVQFYLVSGEEKYKQAAIRAGTWSFDNAYLNLEYRGGTCDNVDIQDKEAGIYALFGFLSLYDLTEDKKWLEAAVGAADYTETWTYAWNYPVHTPWPKHPFNRYGISGQSIITIGGGADVYMAACSYTYYRLYVITGDEHYRDFAEFIHKNTRQSNDIDGSTGYLMPGIGHESGHFCSQVMKSQYHWLPWGTYVEVDPSSRLYDTFGGYEIADAQKLSPEERAKRNRIYDSYCP